MMFSFRSASSFFIVFTIFFSMPSQAQTLAEQAWNAFLQNDIKTAKSKFTSALKQPEQKPEALLGLALLSELKVIPDNSFAYINEFYKSQSNFAPYIYSLWFSSVFNDEQSEQPEEMLKFLNHLASRQDVDGCLKAMAYSRIGKLKTDSRQFAEASKAFEKIGAIANWQTTGEFENISGSGFDKQYNEIIKLATNAVYTNKYGAPVEWFTPPFTRKDKWFDFTSYLDYENSVVFAQTFVKSPKEQKVQLRAGVSGSLKVWLNDQLVISEPEERNNDLDTYIHTVKLHQGANRILVQVGESYAGRSNFLIRLTDENGHPVEGLSSEAVWQNYTPETLFKGEKVEIASEKYFLDQIKSHPEAPVNYILLAKAYLQSEKVFDAQNMLHKLKSDYPKSTYINNMLLSLYNKRNNRTGYESTLEAIKTTDPEHPIALNSFYSEAMDKDDPARAEEYLKKLTTIFGEDNPGILLKRINLATKNKNQPELIRLAEYGYQKYPEAFAFVEYQYLIQKKVRKDNDAAIATIKKYLEKNDSYRMSDALANLYFDAGKVEEGLKVHQSGIDNDPVAVGNYKQLSDIYSQLQRYAEAEKQIRKALTIAPFESSYYSALAKLLTSQGKKADAITAYKNALTYNPVDYSSIEELRKLENKKDVYKYFAEINVNDLIKKSPEASAYPDDNVLILSQDAQVVIYPSGASEQRQTVLVKILNVNGMQAWKEYAVPVNQWQNYIVENAEVIKVNGTKVPAEVKENQLVFTNLEVGDFVYIKHKLFNLSQGQLANKFWDTFYFTLGYPCLKSSYSVLAAKNQKLNYKFSQKDIPVKKSSVEDFVLYNWTAENQVAIKYEDKMPHFDDVANILQLTTIPSWTYISNWYNDLASAKARPDFEVKELVKKLFSKETSLSDTRKAEIIYNYITQNISYSSVSFRQSGLIPQSPSTVLNTRIGDCKDVSTLFLSMAKEAGINANLVLVNTKDQGVSSLMLPSINFNHCIIKINTDNKERFLELTYNYLPFNSIGNYSIGSVILEIDGSNEERSIKLLDPDTRNLNYIARKTNVTVDNSDLLIKEDNYRVAAAAAFLRESYCNLSENERFKNMQDAIRSTSPSAQLKKLSFKYLENNSQRDTLITNLEYSVKDDVKNIAGISIVSLPWSNKVSNSNLTVSLPRLYPVDLSQLFYVDSETEVINIKIPENKSVVESLSPASWSNEFVDYKLDVKEDGKMISVSRTLKLKKTTVPANRVEEFKEIYSKIAASDSKQLAIK